jgi:hypothetical protein
VRFGYVDVVLLLLVLVAAVVVGGGWWGRRWSRWVPLSVSGGEVWKVMWQGVAAGLKRGEIWIC